MSQTNDPNQKSDRSNATGDFDVEMESKTLKSATDSAILQPVEIKIEKLEGRQRKIFAKIQIPYPLEQVWQVLTDYEGLAEFMPNISQSRRLEHPTGGIRLEQFRTKSFMGMNFAGRSVFDVEEKFPHEIHYHLIEGEMKALSAYWRLKPWSLSESKAGIALIYDFLVLPQPIFPMPLVEHVLSHDIPASMLAIRQRLEEVYGSK